MDRAADAVQPAEEVVELRVRVLALQEPGEAGDLADVPPLLGEARGDAGLEARLAVEVGRHDVGLAELVGGGEDDHVAGDVLVALEVDDVADADVLGLDLDQDAVADHPDLALVHSPWREREGNYGSFMFVAKVCIIYDGFALLAFLKKNRFNCERSRRAVRYLKQESEDLCTILYS